MRRALFAAAFFFLTAARAAADAPFRQVATAAPEQQQPEVLLGDPIVHGGYGGPRVAFGRVAAREAVIVGGEGGWIVNHRFILGGAGYGLVTNQPAPGVYSATEDLTMGYGGCLIGYTLMPQRLVHATFTALIGAGGLGTKGRMHGGNSDLGDTFFVLEPTATVELNVARHFRVGVAASYRWVRGVETEGMKNGDLSGLFGSMVLKFGKF